MKTIRKDLLYVGILVGLFSLGGFINDHFVPENGNYSVAVFRGFTLATLGLLILGVLFFYLRKRPCKQLVGMHIVACLLLWVGGTAFAHWQGAPRLHLYYLFSGLAFAGAGIYLLAQNTRGKYLDALPGANSGAD
jgi:hypothetical protein